jgi:protein-S-isoprenylcysteine O-methyltransferase Ste14
MAAGPYGYIRHPMYAGGLTAALGLLAVSLSREVLVAWLVLGASLWCLVEIEERELRQRLGSNYESYSRKTKRLIPRLI